MTTEPSHKIAYSQSLKLRLSERLKCLAATSACSWIEVRSR